MPAARNLRMIELIHLGRAFTRGDGQSVQAVDDVSLIIPEGQFVCLIGASGCGKSTLLQMIAGLLEPSAGSTVVAGEEVAGPGRERGMIFQKDSVFPWMKVIDNVEYGLKCRNVPPQQRRELARAYVRRVGLAHVENAWPRELSGGMLKRVAIAAVFANGSPVLLLDEPFAGLSIEERRDVLALIADIPRAVTIVMIEPDMAVALEFAERITVLHFGQVVVEGTRSEVVEHPRTKEIYLGG